MLLTGVGLSLHAQPIRPVVVMGESMCPAYRPFDIAWTEPVRGPLHRGDVVIIDGPEGTLIKRVAYLPGDAFGQEYRLGNSWCLVSPQIRLKVNPGRLRPAQVPAGHVYVLGDNGNFSRDSREFGPVPFGQVLRRVILPHPYRRHTDH